MDRRSFLHGLLIGTSAAASTALIKIASPEDLRTLATGRDVLLAQPSPVEMPNWREYGPEVYMRRGHTYEPVGFLRDLTVQAEMIDVTSAWDGTVNLVPGRTSGLLRFSGPSF